MQSPLKEVLGATPKVESVATGYSSACGPVSSRRGYVLFCDRDANKILQLKGGEVKVFREASRGARALTFDHQGRLLLCTTGQITRIEKNGSVTVLADAARVRGMRDPVDLVFAVDANIYFCDGTAVYRIGRDNKVSQIARECRSANAVALSANQQTLYVIDPAEKAIRSFGLAADGSTEAGRKFTDRAGVSLKTDEAGRVWVAGEQGIEIFSRQGATLGSVAVPETPTGLSWGEGFHDAIVTSAKSVFRVNARTAGTRTY